MEATMKIKPSELDIIEETSHCTVHAGWVYRTVIVREPNGQLVYWDIPLSRLGDAR